MKRSVVQQLFYAFIIIFSAIITPGTAAPSAPPSAIVIPKDIQETITKELARRTPEGFPAGTLVKTPTGYSPIEACTKGSSIIAYNKETQQQETASVVDIHTTSLQQAIDIIFADEKIIRVAPQTLFYDYQDMVIPT